MQKLNKVKIPPVRIVGYAFLIYLATCCLTVAADFPGRLKEASVTDAQATNRPPVAAFTSTINGDTVAFDASGSSDPDGSIAKYTWNFGNVATAEGKSATFALSGAQNLQVTLTVTDNNQGVAIHQQTVSAMANGGLTDDFSINSVANYTILSGGLNIYDGKAHASGAWTTTYAIHNQELASSDHSVEADVYTDGANATGGLLFRVNKTEMSGYMASFSNGRLTISSFKNGIKTWINNYDGNFQPGNYKLHVKIQGNTIKILVNNNLTMQLTDTKYISGNFTGIFISPYGDESLIFVDNFSSI